MAAETFLFSQDLVSPKVQALLPEGFSFRPLQRSDYSNGHLDPLRDLAFIGDISEEEWIGRFDLMKSCPGTYFVLVIVDTSINKIIGTGSLFIEKKLYVEVGSTHYPHANFRYSLCKLGTQGHIEDIAIRKGYQGKKLGVKLLAALDFIAEEVGSYKVCCLDHGPCLNFDKE